MHYAPRLRELLIADRDSAVLIVNDLLERAHARPFFVRHDDLDWHLHVVDADAPLAERIGAETAMAMAMVEAIRTDELSRLGICAQNDCHSIVLDLSRNRSRISCGSNCGNRAAVATYRARKR